MIKYLGNKIKHTLPFGSLFHPAGAFHRKVLSLRGRERERKKTSLTPSRAPVIYCTEMSSSNPPLKIGLVFPSTVNYALVHDSAAVRLFTFGRLLCSLNAKTHELNSRDRARALTPRTGSLAYPRVKGEFRFAHHLKSSRSECFFPGENV